MVLCYATMWKKIIATRAAERGMMETAIERSKCVALEKQIRRTCTGCTLYENETVLENKSPTDCCTSEMLDAVIYGAQCCVLCPYGPFYRFFLSPRLRNQEHITALNIASSTTSDICPSFVNGWTLGTFTCRSITRVPKRSL